jgi:hypothetical protein
MPTPSEVERLVAAYERVSATLEKKAPRRGAKILCEEFGLLINANRSFWEGVHDTTQALEERRSYDKEFLNNVRLLIDMEAQVFASLGIDESRSGPILSAVYGGLRLSEMGDDPVPDALAAVRRSLEDATKLVCKESTGLLGQATSWVLSWRGARVLAGAAVVGANIAVAHFDLGAVSHISVKVGAVIMKGDLGGIIDLLG